MRPSTKVARVPEKVRVRSLQVRRVCERGGLTKRAPLGGECESPGRSDGGCCVPGRICRACWFLAESPLYAAMGRSTLAQGVMPLTRRPRLFEVVFIWLRKCGEVRAVSPESRSVLSVSALQIRLGVSVKITQATQVRVLGDGSVVAAKSCKMTRLQAARWPSRPRKNARCRVILALFLRYFLRQTALFLRHSLPSMR